MRRVRILEPAVEEAIEVASWYEHERAGLDLEFAQAIDAAIDFLADEIVPLTAMPGVAGARGVRRLVLKRFPYDIVILEHSEEVLVLAVAHMLEVRAIGAIVGASNVEPPSARGSDGEGEHANP